jgi:hypothetical protein
MDVGGLIGEKVAFLSPNEEVLTLDPGRHESTHDS